LKIELGKLNKTIKKLESEIEDLNQTIGDKDRSIDKANQHITFLKNNKEVVVETKHLFP